MLSSTLFMLKVEYVIRQVHEMNVLKVLQVVPLCIHLLYYIIYSMHKYIYNIYIHIKCK